VFLCPFRRGEGPSADQGQFTGDLLQREEAAKGLEARRHLQLVLMTTDHLQDALAALSFLKSLPDVDARRVAVAGHSFGDQLTLLEASRDRTLRAAVTFGAAAGSWDGSPELRDRFDRNRARTHDASDADSGSERLLAIAEQRDGWRTDALTLMLLDGPRQRSRGDLNRPDIRPQPTRRTAAHKSLA
jgi:acetyl esterase/lipase